jgi:biotin transporter BioY
MDAYLQAINATPTPGYLYAYLYASLYAGVFLSVGILLGEE